MSAEPFTYFVFVDLENIPDLELVGLENRPVHVTLLIGKQQRKLDLALVEKIHEHAAQVELIKTGVSGHNALDLILAFYLGQAAQRNPRATFAIVSKDRDFEPMIEHARAEDINVKRYDSFATLPFLASAGTKAVHPHAPTPQERSEDIITWLADSANRNRPSTRKRLLAHIQNALGKDASNDAVESIAREAQARGHLSIDGRGKVIYRRGTT